MLGNADPVARYVQIFEFFATVLALKLVFILKLIIRKIQVFQIRKFLENRSVNFFDLIVG